jgi:uncharacterized protein (TIGR01244 family)
MDIRQITDHYYVSPQISAQDMKALAEQGFTCVICNRPDVEVPPSHFESVIADAATAAGLQFQSNPLTHDTMTLEKLTLQRNILEQSSGKVLAYCASGTRSTVAWMLGHANSHSSNDLITSAAKAGYDLQALRPKLDILSNNS